MAKQILSTVLLALAATSVNAHAFFHTGYVNGQSQGHLFGVRAPSSNNPVEDVTSSAITCNNPLNQPVSKDVIEIAPGDKFGMQWNHNIAGPSPGDGDDPIAASHKGPIMAYMAKVDDASSADGSGLKWFKVAEEGLDTATGTWAVDKMIANKGMWSFNMPSLAPGEYLLRGELLALHSAGNQRGAQFYMSCAGIRVTGSGTCAPTDTVSFPGAYSATDPGVLISIYGNTGKPDNGGKPYTAPGPRVATCGGSAPAGPKPPVVSSSSKPAAGMSSSSATTAVAGPTTMSTRTRPASSSTSASAPAVTTTSKAYNNGNGNGNGNTKPTSATVSITASASETVIKVPSSTAAVTTSVMGTSPAQPSSTGYPMTGPGGKKFVCYEITE